MNGERKPVALKEGDPTMAMLRRERERERERGGVTQWEINAAVERSVVNIPRPARGTLAGGKEMDELEECTGCLPEL